MIDDLVKSTKRHEDFVDHVYKDSKGIDTLGYGTKMPITKEEGELLLNYRLQKKIKELQDAKPFIVELPDKVQNVLYEMAYQIGVEGLLKFHNTLKYAEEWDFKNMSKEMLDSKWAREDSPGRAKELSNIIRKIVKEV